jgi:hypothetical protein
MMKRPLANADSRILLRQWLNAKGIEKSKVAHELSEKRSFGRLSRPLVEKFFSNRTDDRLQLVDEVLTSPGVDARPWLILLAEDSNADVRLAAVTIMATSTDTALLEKAWQTSIRDRDPRIAALAALLRDRRDETQRR